MKTIHVILLTAFAAGLAAVTPAVGQHEITLAQADANDRASSETVGAMEGGPLRTMPHGTYQCASRGDAGGAAFVVSEAESFRIFTASRYESGDGAGTYILRGTQFIFTRGPRKGEKYLRVGDNQLRKRTRDGQRTPVLCTRVGSR